MIILLLHRLLYLTDIDQEGVIDADMGPAQEMGDESIEVFQFTGCFYHVLCAFDRDIESYLMFMS